MIERGKHNIVGVMVNAIDYEAAASKIIEAAKAHAPLTVTALAVHGVMTGHTDASHRTRLNSFDLVVPDGQPVRWALNLLHKTKLKERVYGPDLMLKVLAAADRADLPVYLYGSTETVLARLQKRLTERYPKLHIVGAEPSKFRTLTPEEKEQVVARIRGSGAHMTFVGLGCPRQEVWAYEYRDALSMPIVAVGAAFDFHAGSFTQAPKWMQDRGLEWLFRLKSEPRRLWRRYLLLNPWYVALIVTQLSGIRQFPQTPTQVACLSYG